MSKKTKIAVCLAAFLLIAILAMILFMRKQPFVPAETVFETAETSETEHSAAEYKILPGYVEQDGVSSLFTQDLFLNNNGRYMIRASAIDEVTSAHAIRAAEGYAVTNGFSQTAMPVGESYYTDGAKRITDDPDYVPPVVAGENVFLDTDTLFKCFGYETEYAASVAGDMVRLILHGTGNDVYDVVVVRKDTKVQETSETGSDGPEGVAERETDAASPGDLPEEGSPEDFRIEDTESPKYTEKEFQEIWEKKAGSIETVFKNAVPSAGNVSYKKYGENILSFNPAQKAIMIDTVRVSRPELSDDVFMTAEFSGEWSDQASRTDDSNRAFYEGLPSVYEKTIKTVLGDREGAVFYGWIKEHADKVMPDGYFAATDEYGNRGVEWREEDCGDGVASYALNFGQWIGHTTDDDLHYDVSMYSNGFCITVYRK